MEAASRIKVRFVSEDPRSSRASQLWVPSAWAKAQRYTRSPDAVAIRDAAEVPRKAAKSKVAS